MFKKPAFHIYRVTVDTIQDGLLSDTYFYYPRQSRVEAMDQFHFGPPVRVIRRHYRVRTKKDILDLLNGIMLPCEREEWTEDTKV